MKSLFNVILLICFAMTTQADEKYLTLDEAIAEVLSSNPDVRAAGYRSEAAKARIPQAKALEDPEVGVMFEEVPINTADVNRGEMINYRIEQKIPFPGKRHVRGKAASFDAGVVSETSRARIRDVLLDLKKTYYDLYRLDRSIAVNRENRQLMRQFLGSAKTWYATGQAPASTPLRAQVELSNLENQQILLEQERITHQAHLQALLNRNSHEDIGIPSKLRWPRLREKLETVMDKAIENRPELASLRWMERREKSNLTAAKQTFIPDFSLGFEYNQRPNQQDAWTGTAMINVPIFFWGKNRGAIHEAKANLKATRSEHESMEIHTRHEIAQAYSAVQASQKLVASYEENILPQAKTTLDSSQIAYGSKNIDFLTLIEAARTYRDLQMSYYETQARLGMAFAELERLVGTDLE